MNVELCATASCYTVLPLCVQALMKVQACEHGPHANCSVPKAPPAGVPSCDGDCIVYVSAGGGSSTNFF